MVICSFFFLLSESGIPAQVVAAIDINTTANQIYKHNFPDTPLWNKTIEVGDRRVCSEDNKTDEQCYTKLYLFVLILGHITG